MRSWSWGLSALVLYPTAGGRAVTPIWPPVGLAVALTYIGGYRLLPGIVLGSFALGLRFNAWPLARLAALAQVAQPLVDVRIMKRARLRSAARARPRSDRPVADRRSGRIIRRRRAGRSRCYSAFGARPIDALPYDFMLWWLRDWLGVMVTAPLVFAWVYGRSNDVDVAARRRSDGAALGAVRGIAVDVRAVGPARDPRCADRVRVLPDRRLGGPAIRRARRHDRSWRLIAAFAIAIAGMGIGPFSAFPVEFTQFLLFSFLALGVAQRPAAGRDHGGAR